MTYEITVIERVTAVILLTFLSFFIREICELYSSQSSYFFQEVFTKRMTGKQN
jgi:hypothetical protein